MVLQLSLFLLIILVGLTIDNKEATGLPRIIQSIDLDYLYKEL